jgi:hypothetical protein
LAAPNEHCCPGSRVAGVSLVWVPCDALDYIQQAGGGR